MVASYPWIRMEAPRFIICKIYAFKALYEANNCRQRSDPADINYPQLQAFPEGFRMLAGDPGLRSFSDTVQQNAVSFACLGTSTAQTSGFPDIKCPDGLRAQIFFPSCWNGVDLDSADHKSHVVYPSGTDVSFKINWFIPSEHSDICH